MADGTTCDAISTLELPGKVSRIRLDGENARGDVVYTLVDTPARHEERLRWNMMAKVSTTPDKVCRLATFPPKADLTGLKLYELEQGYEY